MGLLGVVLIVVEGLGLLLNVGLELLLNTGLELFILGLVFITTLGLLVTTLVLLILLRSILESSYAVFSIDFIILYTFINYLYQFSLKNND